MAASKAKQKAVKKAEWKGYHKVNLSKEDEVLFTAWAEVNDFDLTWLEHWAEAGYKLSFSYDDYHTGYSASMYCTQAKMDWAGYTLSAWAGDMVTAFKLLMYKHIVMCGEVWEIAPERSERSHAAFG